MGGEENSVGMQATNAREGSPALREYEVEAEGDLLARARRSFRNHVDQLSVTDGRERGARDSAEGARDAKSYIDIEVLPPQASDRRYVRAVGRESGNRWVCMLLPYCGGGAEERGSVAAETVGEDPFVRVGRWLMERGVPVPKIFAVDEHERTIWLEDCGRTHLRDLANGTEEARRGGYEAAVELLLGFQRSAQTEVPDIVRSRAMDSGLLRWELEHYVEWRLEAALGVRLSRSERSALDEGFGVLVEALEQMPRVVVHRDVQSLNILFDSLGRARLIDFQDALMGTPVYDVVALLRDSYVVLAPDELQNALDRWVEGARRHGLARTADGRIPSSDELLHWFHLQTIQRKLKDAGRFEFLYRVKENASFLPYLADTLGYVDDSFAQAPELVRLQAVLRARDPLMQNGK